MLASPYYLFGGFKQTIDYIQVVMFGSNQEMWITKLPVEYTLTYYLTGRGGWMLGTWIGLDIILLVTTLIFIVYRQQWHLAKRAIAAIIIFIVAYTSVTIPVTKSPFLGLIVTAILLILSYLSMIYWLETLNHYLKKSVSLTLSKFLSLTLISSLMFVQWKNFQLNGNLVNILYPDEAAYHHESLLIE